MGQGQPNLPGREPQRITSAQEANEVFGRAEAALQAERYAEAAALYRQLLQANISPGVMLYRLGMIANSHGDHAAAYDLHLQAIAAEPTLAARIVSPELSHHSVVCSTSYDVEEIPLCPVCGSAEQTAMMVVNCMPFASYHASIHPIRRWVRCSDCGHGFANPRPGESALRQVFQHPLAANVLALSYDRLTLWSDIVHRLWDLCPDGDFLDVGAGNGGLAGVAMDYGYRAVGMDVRASLAETVCRLGVEFLLGDFCTFAFGNRKFDVITMGDVIEHVPDPRAAMRRAASILRPNGVLWISTPNHEGVWTRAVREKDPMWMVPEHIQHFSLRSLKRLLADHGFEVVDFRLAKGFVGCAEVIARRSRAGT